MAMIAVLLAALATPAPPRLPDGVTCEQVRAWVAAHGEARAIAWALRQGYSWRDIGEARRCLR